MAAGVGKTFRMLPGGPRRAEAGRDVAIGLLETHGRADTERLAQGLDVVAAPARRPPRHDARRDGPPGVLGARARARARRRARPHQRAGRRARQALRGHRGPARRRHRRPLDAQRPAPRVAQRPVAELSGRARSRDDPRLACSPDADEVVLIDLTPAGALAAPARGQDLPGRAHRQPRSTASSGSRTSTRCARSRCARSPRRSRPSGSSRETVGTREERLFGDAPASRRRAAARARRARAELRSASSGGPGARRSASARSSTCSSSADPGASRRRPSASSSSACARSRRCSARNSSSSRPTTSPTTAAHVARERGITYILMGAPERPPRARPPRRAARRPARAGAAGRRRAARRARRRVGLGRAQRSDAVRTFRRWATAASNSPSSRRSWARSSPASTRTAVNVALPGDPRRPRRRPRRPAVGRQRLPADAGLADPRRRLARRRLRRAARLRHRRRGLRPRLACCARSRRASRCSSPAGRCRVCSARC